MRSYAIWYLCGLLLLASPNVVSAEIFQCDGKWTNKPCDGAIERTMHEHNDFEAQVAKAQDKPQDQNTQISEPLAPTRWPANCVS